jgi:hypothetical protein
MITVQYPPIYKTRKLLDYGATGLYLFCFDNKTITHNPKEKT